LKFCTSTSDETAGRVCEGGIQVGCMVSREGDGMTKLVAMPTRTRAATTTRPVVAMFDQSGADARCGLKPLGISADFGVAKFVRLSSFEESRREESPSSQRPADLLST
jgi:hypothetical protein